MEHYYCCVLLSFPHRSFSLSVLSGSKSPVSINCNLCLALLIDNFVFTEIEKISESADRRHSFSLLEISRSIF